MRPASSTRQIEATTISPSTDSGSRYGEAPVSPYRRATVHWHPRHQLDRQEQRQRRPRGNGLRNRIRVGVQHVRRDAGGHAEDQRQAYRPTHPPQLGQRHATAAPLSMTSPSTTRNRPHSRASHVISASLLNVNRTRSGTGSPSSTTKLVPGCDIG